MNHQLLDDVVNLLGAHPGWAPRLRELARKLRVSERDYPAFRNAVTEWIRSGRLTQRDGGRIGLPLHSGALEAILLGLRSGAAIAQPVDGSPEIYIPIENRNGALVGDKVDIALTRRRPGRSPEGRVISILERGSTVRSALVQRFGSQTLLRLDEGTLRPIALNADQSPRPGDLVAVALPSDDDPDSPAKVTRVLGRMDDLHAQNQRVRLDYDLPAEFPALAGDEARESAGHPLDEVPREDLTAIPVWTIDPDDAKDFDDALSLEKNDQGWLLGVHIADVAHYVMPEGPTDREARRRGCSVYLVGEVVPMLPEVLSNETCSLAPGKPRATLSVEFQLDSSGKILSSRCFASVIVNHARLTYTQAAALLEGEVDGNPIASRLRTLDRITRSWYQQRVAAGALELDLPETVFAFDPAGNVTSLATAKRLPSHRIVEECMLAANRAVALLLSRTHYAILYRIHDKPDEEKSGPLLEILGALHYPVKTLRKMTPQALQTLVAWARERADRGFLMEKILRTLPKAVYSPKNIGHFGLAFPIYTHFTSPIRRYPDLLVHRALRAHLLGIGGDVYRSSVIPQLEAWGRLATEREILADRAERDSVRSAAVIWYARQVGARKPGILSGMNSYGLFVTLTESAVEGVVPLGEVHWDYLRIDPEKGEIHGERTGFALRIGDPVTVTLSRVDLEKRELILALDEPEKRRGKDRKAGPGRFNVRRRTSKR